MNSTLIARCENLCELCSSHEPTIEYTVSPKDDLTIDNQVAICVTCLEKMQTEENGNYWTFLEGSIWNPEPSVQALSYRIMYQHKDENWASELLNAVEIDDNIIQWALSAFEQADVHKDAYGNVLENGDTVVLTQALNVKGTNFSAAKGTIVKRIKLVHDNTEQIEGKINSQTIIILTKFVKKSS
ncbi:MAG: PhnA domain-containing protein [Chitinophagales bacterium]|nr:PhnA domain-containing protein [Bacteroidota bacterium]